MEEKTMKQLARVYWYWSGAVFVIVGLLLLPLGILSLGDSASGEFSALYLNQAWFLIPVAVVTIIAGYASLWRRSWASVIDTAAWFAVWTLLWFPAAFGGVAWVYMSVFFTVGMILLAWLPRLRAELGVVGTPSEAPR